MADTMNDMRTPSEILADAVKLAEKTGHSYITVTNQCAERIIELLKEQETVEPKQVGLYGKEDWYGLVCVCPDCKAEWMSNEADTHFCPKCGQAVKLG